MKKTVTYNISFRTPYARQEYTGLKKKQAQTDLKCLRLYPTYYKSIRIEKHTTTVERVKEI